MAFVKPSSESHLVSVGHPAMKQAEGEIDVEDVEGGDEEVDKQPIDEDEVAWVCRGHSLTLSLSLNRSVTPSLTHSLTPSLPHLPDHSGVRCGEVLKKQTILKADHYPSCHNTSLPVNITGGQRIATHPLTHPVFPAGPELTLDPHNKAPRTSAGPRPPARCSGRQPQRRQASEVCVVTSARRK